MKVTIATLFLALASVSFAQTSAVRVDPKAYKTALETELSKPGVRYLYEHADAYERLVYLRVMRQLGIDLRLPETSEEIQSLQGEFDTSLDVAPNSANQEETSVAISRSNTQLIVAGANDSRMYSKGMPSYTSTDQGKSWKTNWIKSPSGTYNTSIGDPSIAADDSGNFYYAYLAGESQNSDLDNLIVALSKDGKIWQNGGYVVAQDGSDGFEDKEHLTVDRSPASPHYGRVYLVWMHFLTLSGYNGEGAGARIAWSDDHCQTWSNVTNITNEGVIQFSEVKTGKNGEVFVTFSQPDYSNGTGSHLCYVSHDGGQNFSSSPIADFNNYQVISDVNRGGLKGDMGFRSFPYITHDIDLKTNRIHLVYGSYDPIDSSGNAAAILYYVSSDNFGATWSAAKPVGIANPLHSSLSLDRFLPWVSVNQKTGEAFACYYSSENDPDNNVISGMYRTKLSSGLTDYPVFIGDRDFDPTTVTGGGSVPFIGDYIGSDICDTVSATTWTENRPGHTDGDIYAYIAGPVPPQPVKGVDQLVVLNSKTLWLSAPKPNPIADGKLSFSYYLPKSGETSIELFSTSGIKLQTLASEKDEEGTLTKEYQLSDIPSGEYILRLSTSYGSAEKKVIVVK